MNTNLCVYDCTFKLNITLSCKIKTKRCWLFLSLSKLFLPYNQHVGFICLEYDGAVNLYSIWDLKNHWGSFPGGIYQAEIDLGEFTGVIQQGGGPTSKTFTWKYREDQHLISQSVNSISIYKILVRGLITVKVSQNLGQDREIVVFEIFVWILLEVNSLESWM